MQGHLQNCIRYLSIILTVFLLIVSCNLKEIFDKDETKTKSKTKAKTGTNNDKEVTVDTENQTLDEPNNISDTIISIKSICHELGLTDIKAIIADDSKDQYIIDNFLENVQANVDRLSSNILIDVVEKGPNGLTWVQIPYMSMFLTAYKLTANILYLEQFVNAVENMRSALTKGNDGFLGWYGKTFPDWQDPYNPDNLVDEPITSFSFVEVISNFVEIVICNQQLQTKYEELVKEYLNLLENHLVKKWITRGSYVDLGTKGAVLRLHKDLGNNRGHLTLPHNMHEIVMKALIALYRVTWNEEYMKKAIKLGVRYKYSLSLSDNHYVWNYWDPAGAWDIDHGRIDNWKHSLFTEHKGSYYSMSPNQAILLYHHGLIFNEVDLERFLNTQLHVTWDGNMENPVWHRTNGIPATDEYGDYMFPALAPFDTTIEEYVYGSISQEFRYNAAVHAWTGGPTANKWIYGKYFYMPKASGGNKIYKLIGDKFLEKAENQEFINNLVFEITGDGYIVPNRPSQMDNVPNIAYTGSCPRGYILVPANPTVYAYNDFCVMKYEAKNDGNGNAVSMAEETPWVSINQVEAKAACKNLNTLNRVTNKYDLISNPEWMAIARNVENIDTNWTNGTVGDGCIKIGNVGETNPCIGGDSGYNGSDPDFGTSRSDNGTAQLTLSNNEVIWDISGNVNEWVDWTLGGPLTSNLNQKDRPYIKADGSTQDDWRELSAINIFTQIAPKTSILPSNPVFSSNHGIGKYYAATSSGGAALRGGRWTYGNKAGAFSLNFSLTNGAAYDYIGFRCVSRP